MWKRQSAVSLVAAKCGPQVSLDQSAALNEEALDNIDGVPETIGQQLMMGGSVGLRDHQLPNQQQHRTDLVNTSANQLAMVN
jgi:hypothetical protein